MSSTALSAAGALASELHAFLRETDPARWTDAVANRARERWARIRAAIEALSNAFDQGGIGEALRMLASIVRESDELSQPESRGYWMELRARLMPAYEALAAQLRARSLRAPTLRPTNWSRIGFHVSSALGALVLLELVLTKTGTRWACGLFAGTFWFLEIGRTISKRWNDRLMRVRFFQMIIHPHEHHHVNSATWYATALFLLALFSPALASASALAILGFGDPAAGLVGRRWGKHPLAGGRTLEGSLAFVVFATLAALAVLMLFHPVAPVPTLLVVAVCGSIAGAVAEAVSSKVDDNFVVPVASAAAATLSAWAFGVPL
jgi:dolichol kinase